MGFLKIESGITSVSFLTWPSSLSNAKCVTATGGKVALEAALPLEQLEPAYLECLDEEFDCPISSAVQAREDLLFDWE